MFNLKLIDLTIFLISIVHLCSLMQPTIDVNSRIRYAYPNVERSFKIRLGYIPQFASTLCQTSIFAMIVLFVKERRRHYLAMRKEWQELQTLEQKLETRDANDETISSAEKIKMDYLRRLLSKNCSRNILNIPLETLIWSLIIVINQIVGYARLNAIMYHFGNSNLNTLEQLLRLQSMFLYQTFIQMPYEIAAKVPHNDQFDGIIYEPHLLD